MEPITMGLMAGGALLGALGSKQKNKQTTTTTNSPWAPQASALQYGFDQARNLYDTRPATYTGDLSAGMTDMTRAGIEGTNAFATGTGAALAGTAANTAQTLQAGAPGFVSTAQGIAANGAGPANATAMNTLTAAASGAPMAPTSAFGAAGQGAMGAGVSNAQGFVQQAQGDPAQRALSMGGAYANDPVVQSMIDNASLDVRRNFNEVTAPGLNARASAGGNINSARAGVAEAIARRDAGESVGRIASDIRGAAFGQGINASLTGNAQNNSLALGANGQILQGGNAMAGLGETQRQFDTGVRMDGATSLGQLDLSNRSLDVNTRLGANAQVGQAVGMGVGAGQTAQGMAYTNTGAQIGAGQMLQQDQQRALDAAYEQYMRDYNTRQGALTNYMGVVGSNNWGSQGSSTTTQPGQSPIQGALGGAMMGAGVARYFK
jgi:hypothetical protein